MTPRGWRSQMDLILHYNYCGAVRKIESSSSQMKCGRPGILVIVVYMRVHAAQGLLTIYFSRGVCAPLAGIMMGC